MDNQKEFFDYVNRANFIKELARSIDSDCLSYEYTNYFREVDGSNRFITMSIVHDEGHKLSLFIEWDESGKFKFVVRDSEEEYVLYDVYSDLSESRYNKIILNICWILRYWDLSIWEMARELYPDYEYICRVLASIDKLNIGIIENISIYEGECKIEFKSTTSHLIASIGPDLEFRFEDAPETVYSIKEDADVTRFNLKVSALRKADSDNKILNLLIYIIKNYAPSRKTAHLTYDRLNAMIYLVDWRHAVVHQETITDIPWKKGFGLPEPSGIESIMRKHRYIFDIKKDKAILIDENMEAVLEESEIKTIDEVIKETNFLTNSKFESLISSTTPMVNGRKYQEMDLIYYSKILI